MSAPGAAGVLFGYLAILKLIAVAVLDRRLTNSQRGVLSLLAQYADARGTCCVALTTLADQLFVTRQTVQKSMRALEHAGYFTSQRRTRANGGEGAKVFALNLDLGGAVACPLPQSKGEASGGDTLSPRSVPRSRGVHTPEAAGGCTLQKLQGVHTPEAAHKKPLQETFIKKETSAIGEGGSRGEPPRPEGGQLGGRAQTGKRHSGGETAGQQGGRGLQRPLLHPIASGRRSDKSGSTVVARVDAHNLELQRDVAGRMSQEWMRLDPDLSLFDSISPGRDKAWERARELEIRKRGNGLRYIAGAVARATGGKVTAKAILSGSYARELARGSRFG